MLPPVLVCLPTPHVTSLLIQVFINGDAKGLAKVQAIKSVVLPLSSQPVISSQEAIRLSGAICHW